MEARQGSLDDRRLLTRVDSIFDSHQSAAQGLAGRWATLTPCGSMRDVDDIGNCLSYAGS